MERKLIMKTIAILIITIEEETEQIKGNSL